MNIIAAETTLTFVIMVHIITIDKDSEKPVFRIEGEYDSDLMASFGKIFTSILNHGDGGYINITMVKKLHPLGLFVNRSSENVCRALIDEISKIKPYVMERDYRITLPNQAEEVHVEVDPVPWGLDPYAAADGHVYTPDLVAHFQEDKGTEIKYTADQIHPVKRTEHNFDATEVCDMEISNSLESVGIDQESKSKVHDKLENEIKEIIENCVHDLREIKGLGIPKTMDRAAAEKPAKCTMDTAMPSCKTRLHHSKSVSEILNNSRSQPLHHWKSVSISGDIKTFCEEIEFYPELYSDWPGTNGKLVQVDGEGSENIDQKNDTDESKYFLPQLDGLFDEERIEWEERLHNANKVNKNDKERVETEERVQNRIYSNNRMGTYDAPELSALLTTNIVIFPLGLICVLLGLIQFAGGQTVLLIAKSVIEHQRVGIENTVTGKLLAFEFFHLNTNFERVSYTEPSPSLNRTITYNVNQQQRIGLANTVTGKSWGPFASVDFVYLNTNFYDQERIESEEILHNANKVNKNDKERDETEERVYKRIDSNNRMGIYDGWAYTIVKVPLLGLIQFGRGQTVLLIAKSESAIPTSMSITTILENTEIPYHSDMSLENVQSFVAENLNCSTMPIFETTMRTNQHDVPDLSSTQDVISAAHMTKLIFPNGLFNRDIGYSTPKEHYLPICVHPCRSYFCYSYQ